MNKITPPNSDEYVSYYAGYVERADRMDDVFIALSLQIDALQTALGTLSDEQGLFRDAPNEWSIKEVVGHLNDVERVSSYRLLRISRNDPAPLTGFEQNDYVSKAGFDNYPLQDLLSEFEYLRRANILAINNMSEEAVLRQGTTSGYTVSARALIYMMVGHVNHHMASLHEKYLPPLQ